MYISGQLIIHLISTHKYFLLIKSLLGVLPQYSCLRLKHFLVAFYSDNYCKRAMRHRNEANNC